MNAPVLVADAVADVMAQITARRVMMQGNKAAVILEHAAALEEAALVLREAADLAKAGKDCRSRLDEASGRCRGQAAALAMLARTV